MPIFIFAINKLHKVFFILSLAFFVFHLYLNNNNNNSVYLYKRIFYHTFYLMLMALTTLLVIKLEYFLQFESFQINHCHFNTYIALKM